MAPSPFNNVKLKLALVIVFLPTIWIIANYLTSNPLTQISFIAGYSLITMWWLIYQIKTILHKQQSNKQPESAKSYE